MLDLLMVIVAALVLIGVLFVGSFVFLVAANFAYFYPILTDGLLSNQAWNDRMHRLDEYLKELQQGELQ